MKARKSWAMAYCGMAAALSVALMLLGAVVPVLMFIAPAVASLLIATVCVECGKTMALTAYGAVSLLSLLFVPDKEVALVFVFLLGYYPLVKPRFERIRLPLVRVLIIFGFGARRRQTHHADQHVLLQVAEHQGEASFFERRFEGYDDGFGRGVDYGRELLAAHYFQDRFVGLFARDLVTDREWLRNVFDGVLVVEGGVADLEDDVEGVEYRCGYGRSVAQREDGVAVVVARDSCDERRLLSFGFHRVSRRIGQSPAVEGPVTLFVDGHFGSTPRNGDFRAVGVFQKIGVSVDGSRPVEYAVLLFRTEDRCRGDVVLRGDGDAVFDIVGPLEPDDVVALGVLRDRGYGSAVDDGREQPDLVVELIGLFFEFRELVVYLVDPFPQGGVVEVVAASAAEKKSRCQK